MRVIQYWGPKEDSTQQDKQNIGNHNYRYRSSRAKIGTGATGWKERLFCVSKFRRRRVHTHTPIKRKI